MIRLESRAVVVRIMGVHIPSIRIVIVVMLNVMMMVQRKDTMVSTVQIVVIRIRRESNTEMESTCSEVRTGVVHGIAIGTQRRPDEVVAIAY